MNKNILKTILKGLPKQERFGGCVSHNNWQFKTGNIQEKWSDTKFVEGNEQIQTN